MGEADKGGREVLKIPQEDMLAIQQLIRDYDLCLSGKLEQDIKACNPQKGILEICYASKIQNFLFDRTINMGHSSNGFLLTQNGYFVTCFHCVEDGDLQIIVDAQGVEYEFEGVCAISRQKDIAICKAKINGPKKHLLYKYTGDKFKVRPAVNLTRWNGELKVVGTTILGENRTESHPDVIYMTSTHTTIPGDSGGIIVNANGDVVSIILGAACRDSWTDGTAVTRSMPFAVVINLLRQVCGQNQRR